MSECVPHTQPDSWMIKWLLVFLIANICLTTYFIFEGSLPARKSEQNTRWNNVLLCEHVKDSDPRLYESACK